MCPLWAGVQSFYLSLRHAVADRCVFPFLTCFRANCSLAAVYVFLYGLRGKFVSALIFLSYSFCGAVRSQMYVRGPGVSRSLVFIVCSVTI